MKNISSHKWRKKLNFRNQYLSGALMGVLFLTACQSDQTVQKEAQIFLDEYTANYLKLYRNLNEAQWKANTQIVDGDSTNAREVNRAGQAYANFTGSHETIESAQKYFDQKERLTELQVKQLQKILYLAADNPVTVTDVVKKRIKAENTQIEKLYGFRFKMDGRPVTTNEIDHVLTHEKNLQKRLKAWESSKEVGRILKPGLTNLRNLRNETVQALGYKDYFDYQLSDYGVAADDMLRLIAKINQQLWPLYRELHTYARYELAKKYGVKEVPDYLPAHWLPDRWGQDWSAIINEKGADADAALRQKSATWMVREAEDFYKSLGFPSLPQTFWQRSSLYPLPANSPYKKNTHASAWHIDLKYDVRSLMSVEPNMHWYETAHHELGHIYYYLSYSNKNVPPLLRAGANRAYHEAIGSLLGLASQQKRFLQGRNLIPKGPHSNDMQSLLREALNYVVFIPFSAGTMTQFEKELYSAKLPEDQYNKKWWEIVKKYQGIVPPQIRDERYCDAATKTHINDDPAQYYDYALSFVLLFQLHEHIARKILHQDEHNTNYYGNKEVGKFLKDMMAPGSSKDWNTILKEKTGSELNAQSMLDYFAPLQKWLKEQNRGRKYTLSQNI